MKNQLKNDQVEVIFDTFGAEMQSIKKDGIEYLWQGDKAFWARHSPVLFPIVGKLKNGEYHIGEDETNYKMGGHGFARDNDFELIHEDQNDLVFELTSNEDTKNIYPYDFNFKISYHLVDNKIRVRYVVENNDEKTMYFGIGAHPAFNVPFEKGDFEDYTLTIFPLEKRTFIPLNPPTGMIDLDAREEVHVHKLPLTRDLFNRDALVYTSSPKMEVTLTNNLDDHSVKVNWEEMPFFGLWSPYPAEAPFVCIEPWCGITDDDNTDGDITNKFGINSLEPAETFRCEYIIEIN
ncbi:aldose 1-epimerase family protein [Lactovum miscens]|uniref:Galactose mutarotase-like enzyme n=1 Tax=Lactovum miscens TaxID=190387 RepID=A0A841C795_9LACT|nr:aldose 1-epimerase family protein [Lactovum miscens]MBB5887421.1 galactose mutarotase-like enzyme [Lactovum miscens]